MLAGVLMEKVEANHGRVMITLDPVQLFALRKSESKSIKVGGLNGAGKSTLASAIAIQSARCGRSCLLIGGDASLDRPIAFQPWSMSTKF